MVGITIYQTSLNSNFSLIRSHLTFFENEFASVLHTVAANIFLYISVFVVVYTHTDITGSFCQVGD